MQLRTITLSLILAIGNGSLAQDSSEVEMREPIDIYFVSSYYEQDGNNSPVTGGRVTEQLSNIAPSVFVHIPVDSARSIDINAGVDYIGLGPFKYTSTKKNLSPILGLDGYYSISQELFCALKEGKLNNSIPPIVAIGGIDLPDIIEIMKTGVDGIAVSGLLTNDFSLVEVINEAIATKEGLNLNVLDKPN